MIWYDDNVPAAYQLFKFENNPNGPKSSTKGLGMMKVHTEA